jgi:kynurenine formamidase
VNKARRPIIDLSVPVSPDHWEPEPVTRRVVDHRDGADKLGQSYLYFHATSLWQRLKAKLLRPKQYFIDHRDFPDQMGLSQMLYGLTTHTGTHIDAPYHYGWRAGRSDRPATVTDIPLSWCYGAGVLLDYSRDDAPIDDVTVQSKLADIGHVIAEGDIVLIHTGAARLIGQREYFTQYRAIERSAVRWLVENGVRVIGTDAFSFDRPFCQMINDYKRTGDNDQLWPSHFFGRDRPYLQIERLGQLDELPSPTGFQVCCFPIKLDKADAAWSRVVAIVDG